MKILLHLSLNTFCLSDLSGGCTKGEKDCDRQRGGKLLAEAPSAAIGFMANLAGIGETAAKIKEIIKLHKAIDKANKADCNLVLI